MLTGNKIPLVSSHVLRQSMRFNFQQVPVNIVFVCGRQSYTESTFFCYLYTVLDSERTQKESQGHKDIKKRI